MKLSDAINKAEEALHQNRKEISDDSYWGGPDLDPAGTAAKIQSGVTMRQMIDLFKQVDEL